MTQDEIKLIADKSATFGALSTAASLVTTLDACNQIKACILEIRTHLNAMGDTVPFTQDCTIRSTAEALAYMDYIAAQIEAAVNAKIAPPEPIGPAAQEYSPPDESPTEPPPEVPEEPPAEPPTEPEPGTEGQPSDPFNP